MSEYVNIDRLCQLHEEVRVVYLVDRYRASLDLADGQVEGVYHDGATIGEALAALDRVLGAFKSVSSYRESMFKGRS
jgi:hypothetical protein